MCQFMWPTKDVQQAFTTPMYDQCITISGTGELEPRLFSSWSINDDNTVVTVKIHPEANWHDGTPVTAEDVIWTASVVTNLIGVVKGIFTALQESILLPQFAWKALIKSESRR